MNVCRFCGRPGRFYRNEPLGYVEWHEWAEKMIKTHHQEQCPGCGRFTIWRVGANPSPSYEFKDVTSLG